MVYKKCFFFFLVLLVNFSYGQTKEIDSLFKYKKLKELKTLLFESNTIEPTNLKLAQSKYYNSYKQLEKSFELIFEIDTTQLNSKQKAHYYENIANAYDLNSNYDLAARNFSIAQKYFKKIGDLRRYNYINLDLYYTIANPDLYNEPVEYLNEFKKMAVQLDDPMQMVDLEIELAFNSIEDENSTDHFLDHIHKAYDYWKKDPSQYKLGVIHTFHAFYYTDYELDKDSATVYYNKAIAINKELGLNHKVALGYFSLGDLSNFMGDYEKAIYWIKKANTYRDFSYDHELTAYNNQELAKNYKAINQIDSAYYYLEQSLMYRDSLNIQKQSINLTRFEAEKKERKNLMLENINQKNEAIIIGSIGALVLLSFLSLSIYMNSKKKQLLVEKEKVLKIKRVEEQLKKEQLKALDALVLGQEKERMRIASDLHDNIGSNFMAIKSYFDHLKTEFKESNSSPVFDKTHELLEETYQDIRSLAHLKHSGLMRDSSLVPALRKLSKNVSSFSGIDVDFNSFMDDDLELEEKLELNIFRIVQEAMANVVKHSEAKSVSISMTNINSLFNIIIEDDGKGFQVDQNTNNHSFGLQNIQDRVKLLNGKFTVDSKKGRGTTIIIDVPL